MSAILQLQQAPKGTKYSRLSPEQYSIYLDNNVGNKDQSVLLNGKYFQIVEKTGNSIKVICMQCTKKTTILSAGLDSTSNLLRHLRERNMKNKPQSHRGSNTFRFQGFHEKLKSIRINSRNYILKKIESDSEAETLFWQTIHKWRELNLTLGFREFQDALGNEYQTVAQVLLNEAHIANTIRTYLETVDILALAPVLHSLVAFARDIPDLFYEKHFYPFTQQLISRTVSNTRCHETIENIFVCLVSLFSLLQRYIKNDFYNLYIEGEFCNLFSNQYPWYINELASQTLGNLVRKFPNKKEIFVVCLRRLHKHEDEAEGVGRLVFQCLKSDVARRLHSSSPTTLALLLDLIIGKSVPEGKSTDAIVFCLRQVMSHVTSNVAIPTRWQDTWKEDSHCVWPIMFDKLNTVCNSHDSKGGGFALSSILQFIFEIVQFKQSVLVTDFDETLKSLTAATGSLTDDDVGRRMSEIASKLLNSCHYSASSDVLNNFLVSLFGSSLSPSVIFYFIKLVGDSILFESEILPLYMDFILSTLAMSDKRETDEEILCNIVGIIIAKVTPVRKASDLESWSKYSLDFSDLLTSKSSFPPEKTLTKLMESILAEGIAPDISNIEKIIHVCICLPHVSPMEKEDFVPYLCWIMDAASLMIEKKSEPLISLEGGESKRKKKKISTGYCSNLDLNTSSATNETSRQLVFLISVIVETLYHLLSRKNFLSCLARNEICSILKESNQYRESVHLLKAIDIHFTALAMERDSEFMREANLMDLYPVLAPSLASHKPLVRLLVSRIFSLFPVAKASLPLEEWEQSSNIFVTMVQVESTPVSPLEYKERLRLLSHLDIENANPNRPSFTMYDQAPLLFLIGQLYINFKEFWPPVLKSIAQYAYLLPEEAFWPLWFSKLKLSSHFAMRSLCGKEIAEETAVTFVDSSLNNLHSNLISHPGYSHLNTKPDYLNFRDLLWKAMQQFPDICERRNKDVVTVFFDFLNNELFPADYNVAPTQDISVYSTDLDESSSSEEGKDEYLLESTEESETAIDASHRIRKAPTKSLCEHLALFAKFHNPKVIFKAKELEIIYCEFLSHPYLKAQKLALDAIMTYNHKFLGPYRDSLYNILDDKNFKNEITLFDIEGKGEDESKSLKEEHRVKFMPFLMRILYGKMLYKTGSHTSGKSNIGARKGIVLRFLAGAKESELETFLNLSFDFMLSHLEGNALNVVERVEQKLDRTKVVPLKRMQGALGTLETIFDKIGNLLINKRPFMLKVILFILSTCVTLLENRSEVYHHFLPLLKNIRQMAMQQVVVFFASNLDYKWSSRELEAVFRAAVWPSLARLPDEGIYSPTHLLRLFCCWADNPSYHVLLTRHHSENESLTPMPFVMKLIAHNKCSFIVINAVYDLIVKLLCKPSKDEEETEDEVQPFEVPLHCILPLQEKALQLGLQKLSCGESVVWFCMEDLIVNIKNTLLHLKKDQVISKRELTILIHLAPWITNNRDAKELLDSFVPLLKKNCIKKSEKVSYMLETCSKLIPIIDKPEKYSSDFLTMFSILNGRSPRALLCQVINAIHSKGDKVATLVKWCFDLNAWNEEVIEEIDSETRLKCYRQVNKYLKTVEIFDEDLLLFLIHQNVWILCQAEEQALSDLSVLCLQNLLDMIVRLQPKYPSEVKQILAQHFIPLLKRGLKDKNENVRNTIVSLLCSAVHKCYQFNRQLKDLYPLSNVYDPDSDFFMNMAHLQHGKRTKSLMRLAEHLKEGKVRLQTDSITEFVLPIASVYLFKEEYSSDANLVTSSVVCVGALAKHLPWYHYQNLLKYYLNLVSRELSQLKLGVRVLEVVIDSFHEDVSNFVDSKAQDEKQFHAELKLKDKKWLGENNDDSLDAEPDLEYITPSYHPNEAKAEKVYRALTKVFIPRIQQTLAQRSLRDTEHKVNKKKFPEDEDIKRIPLALALVKLLKKLPKQLLEMNVSSVLMKLIFYLKSRAESIRREARNMLVKVMEELGGEYLSYLVTDLNSLLTRGYQSHVMVFTLHSVLTALQEELSPFHIAPCLSDVVEISIEDLFGDKAEEKGVSQMTSKIREVGAERGYAILGIAAQIISVDQLEDLTIPLKEKLQTHDKKVVNKIICCLQKIGTGLERNANISLHHKSLFIYGILNEKIKKVAGNENESVKSISKESEQKINRSDSFLLEPEPRKVGLMPKTSPKTTSHVLLEFALNLLFNLLKHDHFTPDNKHHCSLLDAYVRIMSECLLSEYPKVSVEALHVIGCLIKYPLPSLKEEISKICGQMFVILNKFSSSGLTKGKLFELVQLDFKIFALIIKEISFYKLRMEHSKVLLYYARNNLDDYNQYHSSFLILHAIIGHKVNMDELHALMHTIKKMSVMSTNLNMLDQARRTYLNYILNYPKKKTQYIEVLLFFVRNVSYCHPAGRMSAALMLSDLITKYPRNVFDRKVEVTIWFKLTEQLIKEDLKEHKAMLQKILRSLFLKSSRKNMFIDNCLKLLDDDLMKTKVENALAANMSAQSLLSLLDVHVGEHPSAVFEVLLPKVVASLHPGRYQINEEVEDVNASKKVHCFDLAINSLLELFMKLMDCYLNKVNLVKWTEHVGEEVWRYMQNHLSYCNLKVRLNSAIILGRLFALYPPEKDRKPPIASSSEMVEKLVVDFCEQLNTECSIESPMLSELGLAVVRNLIYLIRQSHKVPIKFESNKPTFSHELKDDSVNSNPTELSDSDTFSDVIDSAEADVTFLQNYGRKRDASSYLEGTYWVLHRVGVMAYDELRKKGKNCTFRRECLLNLIAGVVVVFDKEFERASNIVSFVINHLTRELSDKSLPEAVASRTKEVAGLVRERIGVERYSEEVVRVQTSLERKRSERKARERERVVSNPELATQKKTKKHKAKREAKKRKFAELKLNPNKRRRLKEFAIVKS